MITKVKASALENYSKYLYQSQISLFIIYCFFCHNTINVNSDVLPLKDWDDLEVGNLWFFSFSTPCHNYAGLTTSKDKGHLTWVNPYSSVGFILLTLPARLIRRDLKGAYEIPFIDINNVSRRERERNEYFCLSICPFANYIYFK